MHVKSHADLNCYVCEKECLTQDKLNRHKYSMHGNQMFTCQECDFSTNQIRILKGHMIAKHKVKKCSLCAFETFSNFEMTQHGKSHSKRPRMEEPHVQLTECFRGKVYTKSYKIQGKADPLVVW